MKPRARKNELIAEAVNGEIIIYDKRTHHAHCLSPVVGFVWENCDGSTGLDELALRVAKTFSVPVGPGFVVFALRQLKKAHLLEVMQEASDAPILVPSRRAVARQLATAGGAAAALFPMITSILAPTPAMARSGDYHVRDDEHDDHRGRHGHHSR